MSKDNLRAGLHTFYALALTQALSLIGSRISTLAISIWIYRQTGNVTPLGLVSFFQILPYVLGANIGGVLADRYNRRLLMAIFDFGQALCTLALLASFASGGFQLWHLYGVNFLQSLFTNIQRPA
jgi:MFS family permease